MLYQILQLTLLLSPNSSKYSSIIVGISGQQFQIYVRENMIKIQQQNPNYKFFEPEYQVQKFNNDSQQYIPPRIFQKMKRQFIIKKQKKLGFNTSFWKLQENIAYMEFLIANQSLFKQNRGNRRIIKINVLMSQAIKTRSSLQCRSHHQKMIKFHGDIPSIVEYIKGLKVIETSSNTLQAYSQIKKQEKQKNCDP